MKSTVVTLALMVTGVGLLCYRDTTSAADRDTTSWGAADPAWSPDGRQIAFTLYGSIWTVSATGGVARQVTSGPGYHAHPAWSPKGDAIAYVAGLPPAGLLPNISGKLMTVTLSTEQEREITAPYTTAGTPSWSPGAGEIAIPLMVPQTGALLHALRVSGGPPRLLQQRPQRGQTGNWMFTSWGAGTNEIYFTGRRQAAVQNGSQKLGAEQVWSMPGESKPVMIQLALTPYRLTDIAQIHAVSAIPDGSGVVYAAVGVNGKGDRELYRVPRGGGVPVPLTNTPRDEFSPALSPDGKTIAHVSNHLGNLDIFTMPVSGGEKTHLRISQIEFQKPSARLRIKTLDELGNPTPVRLWIRASDSKAYSPRGVPLFHFLNPASGQREGFFLTTGDDTVQLPAGKVDLRAVKGIEYVQEQLAADAAAGQVNEITIRMQRWTNWNQKGWFTGENHFHANYNGSYYQRPPDSMQWLESEDLNTANMIVANAEGAFVHDKEFFTGGVAGGAKPRFALYWGQEYRNSDPLGHMAFLNIKKQVPPSFTSVVGSNSSFDYPLNTMAAIEARKQGGLVVYVHPFFAPFTDPMDTNLGAKEAPITAAMGAMDGIDVLPYGPGAYEMWYRLLNSGVHIIPGAGTDVFTNWRGINRIPGDSRQYVETGSAFQWDRWVERYRAGRVFVTNGPLLTFSANGETLGSVVKKPGGENVRVRLEAEVSTRVPVDRIEFLQNGRVIHSQPVTGQQTRAQLEVTITGSAWFAARVEPAQPSGQGPRAHSAPIYFELGKPVIVREDIELMLRWIAQLWNYLEERDNFGPAGNRVKARAMFDQAIAHYRAKL
jgi:TolB protein